MKLGQMMRGKAHTEWCWTNWSILVPLSTDTDSQQILEMEKRLTLIQTIATAGVFSAISFWYGFMFGRESSRKDLSQLIEDLRSANPSSSSSSSSHS